MYRVTLLYGGCGTCGVEPAAAFLVSSFAHATAPGSSRDQCLFTVLNACCGVQLRVIFASRLACPRRTVCLRLLTVRGPHAHHWQLDPNFRTHTSGSRHGRFVPAPDLMHRGKQHLYSITSSASPSSGGGIVSPGTGGLEVHDHPIGTPILTAVRAQMSDEPNVAALGQNQTARVLARAALKAAAQRSIAALASSARPPESRKQGAKTGVPFFFAPL